MLRVEAGKNLQKMLNFFKKTTVQSVEQKTTETDVMEVVERGYPKIVQEIHHEFMNAGDRLLKTANDLLDTLSIPNQEKVAALKKFGFHQTTQVKETVETQKNINEQKIISEAISDFRVEYPNYKYITIDIAEKICAKYNLFLGPVGRYKGFVPQKNLDEISNFFKSYPKDETVYLKRYYSLTPHKNDTVMFVSEEEYNAAKEPKKESPTSALPNLYQASIAAMQQAIYSTEPSYSKEPAHMAICAPIKDMNMDGMKLEGVKMIKDVPIPDPVVLIPKNHKNGTVGYLILTAWGDEASDELVVNQNKN